MMCALRVTIASALRTYNVSRPRVTSRGPSDPRLDQLTLRRRSRHLSLRCRFHLDSSVRHGADDPKRQRRTSAANALRRSEQRQTQHVLTAGRGARDDLSASSDHVTFDWRSVKVRRIIVSYSDAAMSASHDSHMFSTAHEPKPGATCL